MNLKQFLASLTPEQKAYITNYISIKEEKIFEEGQQEGYRRGIYAARNALNERFGL